MRLPILFAALTSLFLPVSAHAQDNAVVVELFTSQGCSACPPADRMLGELAERDDVIALALHVDYWDYIGWADTFASPQFTQRQQSYGRVAGSAVVYTPQMIIAGQDHVVGYRPMSVADLIAEHASTPDPIAITISAASAGGYMVAATTIAQADMPEMIEVHLVAYSPHEEVEIMRGENAGRHASHYNVVRSWAVVAEWDGRAPFSANLAPESDLPHAVLFQAANHGPILGAAKLD